MDQTDVIVETLLQDGREEILRAYHLDSCIATTKIIIDVLAHFHYLAQPLSVKVMAFNPAFVQRIESGAEFPKTSEISKQWSEEDGSWSIGIGYGRSGPNKWPGHLVAVLQNCMIDASLDQASRPQRNINLGSSVFEIPVEFIHGKEEFVCEIDGSVVKYTAFPNDQSYQLSPNWHSPEQRVIDRIIQIIDEKLT